MAITLLRLPDKENPGEHINLMVKTSRVDDLPEEHKEYNGQIFISKAYVDDKLQPISKRGMAALHENLSEEEFHKDLRKQAAEHKHLITSHSTDPEWNPENYVRTLDQAKEKAE